MAFWGEIRLMRRFRIIHLICAFALLLQGLLPAAQAIAAEIEPVDGAFPATQFICTAYGIKHIPVENEDPSPLNGDTSSDTCPLCNVHAAKAFLPVGGTPLPLRVTTVDRQHPGTGADLIFSVGITPTPPRGPPAV